MSAAKISVSHLTLYNPARLKDTEIVAVFVARKPIFDRVLADIAGEKLDSRAQHHLVVGQRGMGKSMLLARLATELRTNEELSKRFVPLVFAEEQYTVDRLSKFWLNCLDALADAAERAGDNATSDRIDAVVRLLKPQPGGTAEKDDDPARTALSAFLKETDGAGKRPVLLVDNLQLVFERLGEVQQHALRELLMRPGSPILVGASPSPPPESHDYGAAFYDHFKIHYLRPMSADEMRDLMVKLAETTNRTDVRDNILTHPERLKTLRELTGGNPRTVVTLFFLYAEDFAPSVFADLENLLDRVTPLYKAVIEELSEQQQVVASAIADHWSPITARALSQTIGLPMASVSAQLDRLEKTGFVGKVEIFDQSPIGYQIAERFFNVWFLMRSASRRQRRALEFLARFIECFYEAKDRPQLAQDLMKEQGFSPDHLQFAKALAYTLDPNDKEELTRHAELDALRQKATETRQKLEEIIEFSKLTPATLAFDELRDKLMTLVPSDAGVTPNAFAEEVLGDRMMFLRGEREKLATSSGKLSKEEICTIRKLIADTRKSDESEYGEASVAWFRQRLAAGQLRSVEDLEDWNRSFLKADDKNAVQMMVDSIPSRIGSELGNDVRSRIESLLAPKNDSSSAVWRNWGYDLHTKLCRYPEAEAAYRKAIEIDPRFARPWDDLGDLLQYRLGRYAEAEAAYREAIEIDPRYVYSWNGLGNLLQYRLGRYAEAEVAYRKAIELDLRYAAPWNGLGNLLRAHLGRYAEAEVAYCKAIDLNPRYAAPWNGLGNLLRVHLGRYAEAEAAYRKAIEIDPRSVYPWNGLGNLLQVHLGRYAEAEAAYRKAIDLDPRYVYPRNGLGNLLQDRLGRYAEAEVAYRKAIELDPRYVYPWNGLGRLLQDRLGRYEEAELAYRKAIELDPRYAAPWNNLGNLLQSRPSRYEEAEAAYRKAIELDPRSAIPWDNLGDSFRDHLGRYEEAEAAYRKAIEFDARYAVPWNGLGNLLQDRLGRYEEAELAYRKAIEFDARYAAPWNGLGILLQDRLGRYEEAEAAYRKAIELDPRSAVPWDNLGDLLQFRLGRYEEAEAAYRKAIELDPRSAVPWDNLGDLLRGHFGRYDDAELAYRKAIELDPRYVYPWNGLGNLLRNRFGRYEEAEAAYRKAIEIDPRFAVPWNGLGNLLHSSLGRYDEAEAAYRKAIELDPRSAVPWNNQGNLLRDHLGRYEEAEAAYRKAIELDPRYAVPWNGLGNLYCDHWQRYSEAASAFTKALEIDRANESAAHNLVFLYRDFIGNVKAARDVFELLRNTSQRPLKDSVHLHEVLFAAYDANWGVSSKALIGAIVLIGNQLPSTTDDDWFRTSAVLLHLNYGEELLVFLRESGADTKLRPWYEALSALQRGDRRYLQNIPVEVRTTAEYYFDQIEKRLNALPEKTRRRPVPKPAKKRRKP